MARLREYFLDLLAVAVH